jgi:hypothetical protein
MASPLGLWYAASPSRQAGQFIGARADFVPEQICRKLCLLQDQVPPMSAERARQVSDSQQWAPRAASSNALAGTQGVLLIGALLIQTDTVHKERTIQQCQPAGPHTLQLSRANNTFSDLQRQGP